MGFFDWQEDVCGDDTAKVLLIETFVIILIVIILIIYFVSEMI